MDSCAEQLTMKTKVSLILALSTFISCDKFCENGEGDLIWIKNARVYYNVDDPQGSLVGSLDDYLEVDDHEYTYQISPRYTTSDPKIILFYEKGFKNGDKIDWNTTMVSNLIRENGFKDINFVRQLGYPYRTKPPPVNNTLGLDSNAPCYHYECDASVINENCNPTLNTPESKCELKKSHSDWNITDDFGIKSKFYGQCQMELSAVSGNIFNEWLGSAWTKTPKLPTIEVLVNTVNFNWGTAASEFPEGTVFLISFVGFYKNIFYSCRNLFLRFIIIKRLFFVWI